MGRYFRVYDKNRTDAYTPILKAPAGSQILHDEIEDIVGDKECPANGIPYKYEVDGWGELASVGEIYETKDFVVECISEEEYNEYVD